MNILSIASPPMPNLRDSLCHPPNTINIGMFKANCSLKVYNRGFHKHTTLAKMTILASETLLCENKKNFSEKCYPQWE